MSNQIIFSSSFSRVVKVARHAFRHDVTAIVTLGFVPARTSGTHCVQSPANHIWLDTTANVVDITDVRRAHIAKYLINLLAFYESVQGRTVVQLLKFPPARYPSFFN